MTSAVVAACLALFALQWSKAPRVEASPSVTRQLPAARGELFLGETFEGLPLRTVHPFLYSTCEPGKPKKMPVRCQWVKVVSGRVSGSDRDQISRATRELRPVA